MFALLGQVRAPGADLSIAISVFVLSAVSIVLSGVIAVVLVRGYRRGPGRTGMLWLAVGLLLLTTVPELLRIALPTVTGVDTVGRSILVSATELAGLGAILWSVFGEGAN